MTKQSSYQAAKIRCGSNLLSEETQHTSMYQHSPSEKLVIIVVMNGCPATAASVAFSVEKINFEQTPVRDQDCIDMKVYIFM